MKTESTADLATLLAQAGWLRRFARALVGDAAAADDLAQETMLSALHRPAPGGGRAWLATVARHLAVDRFRGSTRRQRREDAAHAHDPAAGSVASPEALIGDAQIHRHVAEAVARLAEPLRQTVVLRFYEGLSSAEIARRLSQPEGTIRWRLKEALDRVRADLDARYGDDRSAWWAALAPLLPAPSEAVPSPLRSGERLAHGTAPAASPAGAAVAAGVLAIAVAIVVTVVRWPAGSRAGTTAPPFLSGPTRSAEARAPSGAPVTRAGLPNVGPPSSDSGASASAPATPGRTDAASLAEELLEAIERNDYDAFVAKGSPSFRVALDPAKLGAASAALAGRLSGGHHLSTLGNVHRRHTIDWFFKVEFDDGGDDALCTLAMDRWQVAGFLVTKATPQLPENHHE